MHIAAPKALNLRIFPEITRFRGRPRAGGIEFKEVRKTPFPVNKSRVSLARKIKNQGKFKECPGTNKISATEPRAVTKGSTVQTRPAPPGHGRTAISTRSIALECIL